MINSFIVTLFLTFIFVRTYSYFLHDKTNYGTKKERSYTLTGVIRKLTGRDIHHFHLGLLLLIFCVIIYLVMGVTGNLIIISAVGISLVIDQLSPILLFRKTNYFSWVSLGVSALFHILIAIFGLMIKI